MCKLERHHIIINSWKVFSRVLLERMKKEVEAILRDEQAGFRQERSCTDQIATLRKILEQSLEWNTSLFVVFIDYEKAFDSLDRSTLWKLLQHYGIPEKIIRMIRLAYEPSTCQVIHGNTNRTVHSTVWCTERMFTISLFISVSYGLDHEGNNKRSSKRNPMDTVETP